jgi:CheY-like chemotaxis protein
MTSVLVVDDQPQVREILRRLLASDGYDVRVVADGAAALEALEQSGAVDVVVTDLTMPAMGGRDLVSRLRRTCAVKVLYVSGQHDAPEAHMVSKEHAADTAFLAKPFSRSQLLDVIHSLAGPAAPEDEDS